MKKCISMIMTTILGTIGGAIAATAVAEKTIAKKEGKIDKFKNYYNMLNQWLIIKQEGKSLAQYFEEHNIKTIAIYGMGEMGNRLYDELIHSNIEIKYGIDQEADNTFSQIEVYELSEALECVDAVVVTAIFSYEEIAEKINQVMDSPVISLEDIVYEI